MADGRLRRASTTTQTKVQLGYNGQWTKTVWTRGDSGCAGNQYKGGRCYYGLQFTGTQGEVRLWNKPVALVALLIQSPDGKSVASGATDGIIKILDVESEIWIRTLEGHTLPVRSLAFSPDCQFLVTASDDCHLKVYDVQNPDSLYTLSGHGSWVLSVTKMDPVKARSTTPLQLTANSCLL